MADLTKPSNIARGSTIQDTDVGGLYDLLLGTSNYDNIKLNGVKVWAGILSQTGTDAPVASVIYNTLGGTIVWSRDGAGVYTGTLASAFTVGKTLIFFSKFQFLGDEFVAVGSDHSNAGYFTFQVMEDNVVTVDVWNKVMTLILVFP